VRRLADAGGTLLAGTDAPNPGTVFGASLHRELELLVRCGISPAQALAAATADTPQAFLLLRLRRQEPPERRKQCANVSLIFPPVYNLNPVACAFDINSARSAGCDHDLLAPREHTYLRSGLNLPGFRVRSGDAKPALRYCFYAGVKNFIHSCGKVRAVLIACGHFSSIHAHSVFTPRSAGKMLSRLCLSRRGHVTRNASPRPRGGHRQRRDHRVGPQAQSPNVRPVLREACECLLSAVAVRSHAVPAPFGRQQSGRTR